MIRTKRLNVKGSERERGNSERFKKTIDLKIYSDH